MFELSAVLTGHSADIRAICLDSQGHIVTGSRDKTAIVWERVDTSPATPAAKRWVKKCQLKGHGSFVNCVAALKATPEFPEGLIVTGGQDKMIHIYFPGDSDPIQRMEGHEDGVTCLSTGWNGTIISGSADSTVRVWEGFREKEVLRGHTAPVWDVAIFPGRGTFLSASGDKTIILWSDGKKERVFKGHVGAVRKLVLLPEPPLSFVSVGNDGKVCGWEREKDQPASSATLSSSFLYSACLLSTGAMFTVTGEDGSVLLVSRGGSIEQSIQVPAVSAWTCAALPDSDVVVGSSDGVGRIFTPHSELVAPLADRERMAEELASQQHSKEAIGDLALDKLPGVEALNRPGTEGQTLMVKNGGRVELYKFTTGCWQKIGDVQDAYDKDKHELEGEKFDQVISVDVEDGKPALKLGINKTDDPWVVAQQFLDKHMLPQAYLEQIANYITQNTGIGMKPLQFDSDYSDPYTGGSRYIPPSSSSSSNGGPGSSGLPSTRHFPNSTSLSEKVPEAKKLTEKLREHNEKVNDNQQLGDTEWTRLEEVIKNASGGSSIELDNLKIIQKLLSWPSPFIFPCLDLFRSINKELPATFTLQEKIRVATSNATRPGLDERAVRVSLRLWVDISVEHRAHCAAHFVELIQPLLDCVNTSQGNIKFVCSSLCKIIHNVSCDPATDELIGRVILDSATRLLEFVSRTLPEENHKSLPQFHLLVAIGNLVSRHRNLSRVLSQDLIASYKTVPLEKSRITATDILSLSQA